MLANNVSSQALKSIASSKKFFSTVPVGERIENVPKGSGIQIGAAQSKVTELKNGIKVATVSQNHGTGVSVGVFVKSGTRNETSETYGASAFLKRMAFQSTNTKTSLRLVREIEHLGGTYRVASGREHTLYASDVTPDKLPEIIPILSDVLSPALLDWEVRDEIPFLEKEVKRLESDARGVVSELLHQEAYRNKGLGNSLHAPLFNLRNLGSDELLQYIAKNYTADRITVVATGNVDHQKLVDLVEQRLGHFSQSSSPNTQSKYVGGDVRIAADADTHLAIGFEGVAVGDKDAHALATLQHLLGSGVAIEDAVGAGVTSNLFRLVTSDKWLKEVSAFNVNYTDSGLFGVFGVAKAGNAAALVNGITSGVKKVVSSIDDAALKAAKNRYKADLFFNHESRPSLLEFAGYQALATGKVQTVESFAQGIEAVTVEDLKRVAKKAFSQKPTLVAVGDIQDLPTTETIQKALSS